MAASLRPMSSSELRSLFEDVRNRIDFLCKDLLEVNEVCVDQTLGYRVDFIHRTVRDFIMIKDIHRELVERATENGEIQWDAHQALCKVELARAKQLPLKKGIQSRLNVLFALIDTLISYAHEVEIEQKKPESTLLDQLDQVISKYADVDMAYHWTNARDAPRGVYYEEVHLNCFLALAIQSRQVLYTKEKLNKNPKLLPNKRGRPLLDYALRPIVATPTRLPQAVEFIDFDMVRMLLDKGANPNEKVSIYGNITVGGLFLLSCYEKESIKNIQAKETWFKAAEMMIRKGADKGLKLETTRRETVASGSEGDAAKLKTAKYRRVVTKGGAVEVDVRVELTAIGLLTEIFGGGRMQEVDAIVPEVKSWSFWNVLPWV